MFGLIGDCFNGDAAVCRIFPEAVVMLKALRTGEYDLVLLDAEYAREYGLQLLVWSVHHVQHNVPVLMLGDFLDRQHIFEAFDAGVTDIVCGRFDKYELYARVYQALKKSTRQSQEVSFITVGAYSLDKYSRTVHYHGQPISLTGREFSMAWLFFANPNATFTRQQLASSVWGNDTDIVDRTLEQHIYRLRKKLFLSEENGIQLKTLYAQGYRLEIASYQLPDADTLAVKGLGPTCLSLARGEGDEIDSQGVSSYFYT